MLVPTTNSIAANASVAPAQTQPVRFSRPRFALLVLLGVYPLITLLLYLVLPLTDGWPIWQRTLLIAPIMVTIMVWGLIPGVQSLFRAFINPAGR